MARSERISPATLGLKGPHAAEDLDKLHLDSPDVLWTLAGAGNPDLLLNTLMRLVEAVEGERDQLLEAIQTDSTFRVRLFALLGGSSALGDHLVAHPSTWKELAGDLPGRGEMFAAMLESVKARRLDGEPLGDEPEAGTYRAQLKGPEAKTALKSCYRTLLMRIAALDLAGTFAARKGYGAGQPVISFPEVTGALSDLADAALTAALAVAVYTVRGDQELDVRLGVMAMGKCGARELNYISDVDVIFVADDAGAVATKIASEFMRIGSACFFEVDANLRPEGKSGALVRTLDSHVTYYRRWAETWEFQAQLKSRPMTGDVELAQDYVDALAPMVWEASRRDSFVEDVQRMRRRVVDNVPSDLKDRELKLGSGGLRDVEFAVQLLQLVHGRSDDSLRVLATTQALEALVAGGYVGRVDGTRLIKAYEHLRLMEHRLQLHRLRRTHALPAKDDRDDWGWLATTAGFTARDGKSPVERLEESLKKVRRDVSGLHAKLFYRPLLNSVVTKSVDELRLSPTAARDQLAALGYTHPARAVEHLTKLATGSSRKAKLQAILLPSLLEYLGTTPDPDAGLLNYRKLSEAAEDRTWFLRMLRDEGIVAERLMFILGTSPYTSELVINAPDVVKQLSDGASGPKLLEAEPERVYSALLASAKRHRSASKAVARARGLRRLELARIACADLLGFMDVRQVCLELSTVWLAVLEAGLRAEIREGLNASGEESPKARLAIIGMGRLGGRELGYGSDADVMVVAEPAEGVEESEAIAWAGKVVDSMRRRLATPSGDPPLDVDLGLRPEGRSGAVVRTVGSYERYYREWGETWEIQALQRAAFAAGDKGLAEKFLLTIDQFRYPEKGASAAQVREVRRIKARVDDERLPRGGDRTTHTKLGRGGLSDIEWTVQLLTMEHAHTHPQLHNTSTLATLDALEEANDPDIITASDVRELRDAWIMATDARNALVLAKGKRKDQLPQPGPELARVAAAAGYGSEYQKFLEDYLRVTRRARRIVDRVFWGEESTLEFG
ncbi:bifunctional [glutamine synthetase] adenylyltransferase/[glutamine synthetase]-adenylyl-L-tyrosine phosphorylase [Corynebacterium tapiri]|uniref:Bifunctional [glutamine synthetase] adenylyltransferase/[glutamine synthetase]-adenylyl-L-tyrosine phosphorylase n=1 Tax=Corynebacterium tapiri TaxID=1448266 RepID=A0A5C4U5I2_9CORY|nr:bifunctional [glutamine synthetase] adenylyltransferase/[glutamine synthetase]-adenylyl-L-tyrosine phosphorylase [Corynebacterium tapiri]TNL98731.1 bifunctional [glutamine synthetase] adenylyltransferase/[glutamine synthetase]-adenylyl-L-tyrosine phosphorylase [Corynebacterium tapiri]